MLSTFLLATAPQQIACPPSEVADIAGRQSTLSERLFDAAEEHALTVLLDAWADACANDISVFRRVSSIPFIELFCIVRDYSFMQWSGLSTGRVKYVFNMHTVAQLTKMGSIFNRRTEAVIFGTRQRLASADGSRGIDITVCCNNSLKSLCVLMQLCLYQIYFRFRF